mmetsp:Transcript_10596/g.33563  ORF Transcript_10596/g.33563 Transcript_10596/m.33563 type:complete len:224 (-) Transcript_10596:930-1601(-)
MHDTPSCTTQSCRFTRRSRFAGLVRAACCCVSSTTRRPITQVARRAPALPAAPVHSSGASCSTTARPMSESVPKSFIRLPSSATSLVASITPPTAVQLPMSPWWRSPPSPGHPCGVSCGTLGPPTQCPPADEPLPTSRRSPKVCTCKACAASAPTVMPATSTLTSTPPPTATKVMSPTMPGSLSVPRSAQWAVATRSTCSAVEFSPTGRTSTSTSGVGSTCTG